jgi:hypothetical protein
VNLLRTHLLRADALFLAAASIAALHADWLGLHFGVAPLGRLFTASPQAALGFVEAHGVMLVFGVLVWRARSDCRWHLAASAVHLVMFSANLAFWPYVVAGGALGAAAATFAHGLFPSLHLYALYDALTSRPALDA